MAFYDHLKSLLYRNFLYYVCWLNLYKNQNYIQNDIIMTIGARSLVLYTKYSHKTQYVWDVNAFCTNCIGLKESNKRKQCNSIRRFNEICHKIKMLYRGSKYQSFLCGKQIYFYEEFALYGNTTEQGNKLLEFYIQIFSKLGILVAWSWQYPRSIQYNWGYHRCNTWILWHEPYSSGTRFHMSFTC